MNLKIRPLRSAIDAVAVIACLSIPLGIGCDWSGAVVLLTYGAVASPLCYYAESGSRLAKRILLALASVVFGVIPCVVVIGGIDCEPINDSDLLLPESETHYCADGNGWAVLSNLLCQVERERETNELYEIAQNRLRWYADPTNQEWVLECYEGRKFLSNFTNKQQTCAYIKSAIQSNEWVTLGVDATVSSARFAPPPPCMLTDDQFCLPICELLELNRSLLAAELRCQIESGDIAAAIASLRRNLRLATLLQMQCGTFVEYLVGAEMIDEDISCLEQVLADNMISQDGLNAVDMALNDLPGFSDESVSRALKREYAIIKESSREFREEGYDQGKSRLHKRLHAPIYRYMCHPNRTLRQVSNEIRSVMCTNVVESINVQKKDRDDKSWYDIVIPNSCGRILVSVDFRRYVGRVKKIKEKVRAFQNRIREKTRAEGKSRSAGEYFPLVLTNGCYYTKSLKRIVGVCGTEESVVVGGDVEIIDEADFETIKNVVIPIGCDKCLDQWFDAFREPRNLETIAGVENHPEVGLSGGVVYDRRTKRLINILAGHGTIVVPKDVIVDAHEILLCRLAENEIRRIHFCGNLPRITRRKADSFGAGVSSWWKHKTWRNFRRVFMKSQEKTGCDRVKIGTEVTVSRQNADDRTRKIVDSGNWEGLAVRWGEQ